MAGPGTKDIKLKVTVEEDTRGATKAAKALDETAKSADKLDHSMKRSKLTAKDFDSEIKRLTEDRAKLIKNTEDLSDGEFVKERRRINNKIALYKRMKAELAEAEKASSGFNPIGDFMGGGPTLSPSLLVPAVGVLAPAIGVLAIQLGAMIEGVLSGGFVAAGLAGGIFAATKDPTVRATASEFGHTISQSFFGSGKNFVGPVRDALNDLAGDFQSLNLGNTFDKALPALDHVKDGISGLVSNLMPGFNDLLDHSGEISSALGSGLSDTGEALGELLHDMANSKGTVDGLVATFDTLNRTLRGTGEFLGWAGDSFHDLMNGIAGELQFLDAWGGWIPVFGDSIKDARAHVEEFIAARGAAKWAEGFDAVRTAIRLQGGYTDSIDGTTEAVKRENEAFKTFSDQQMGVENSAIGWEKAIDDFTQSIHDNGVSMDITKQKGRDNASALLDLVSAAQKTRQANLDAGMGADEANKKYQDQIQFIEILSQKLGIAKDDIKKLVGTYEINFQINQIAGSQVVAWSTLRNAERKNPGYGVSLVSGPAGAASTSGFHGFASGGQSPPSGMFWVGEEGPELANRQGLIKSHSESMAMAGMSSNARPLNLSFGSGAGADMMRLVYEEIVRMIQARGGTLAAIGIRS